MGKTASLGCPPFSPLQSIVARWVLLFGKTLKERFCAWNSFTTFVLPEIVSLLRAEIYINHPWIILIDLCFGWWFLRFHSQCINLANLDIGSATMPSIVTDATNCVGAIYDLTTLSAHPLCQTRVTHLTPCSQYKKIGKWKNFGALKHPHWIYIFIHIYKIGIN